MTDQKKQHSHETIRWVAAELGRKSRGQPSTPAPNDEAAGMLAWIESNDKNEQNFWQNIYRATVLPKSFIDKEDAEEFISSRVILNVIDTIREQSDALAERIGNIDAVLRSGSKGVEEESDIPPEPD